MQASRPLNPQSDYQSDPQSDHPLRLRPSAPLPAEFFARPVVSVALDLLGLWLVRSAPGGQMIGRIVEVEAYLAQGDPACHASRGRSRKNASMFGPPGRAYVYAIHSRYCLNLVTEPRGCPSAVLIRALEPLAGIAQMQRQRPKSTHRDLTRGPGRLCEALRIAKSLDGWPLSRPSRLWVCRPPASPAVPASDPILQSPRIGVTAAGDLPLRFFFAHSPFVSRSRKGTPISA